MPLFWFNSYFHATVTTQSGSCSKRTHLCHHTASRVDPALDSALNMRAEYFQCSVFAQTRAAKQAGFYVYEHWTRSDMCLSNMSETRAVKTRQDACQLEEWRHRLPRTAPQARRVATSNACVSRNGTQGWTGRCRCWENSCDLWIPRQNRSNGAEQRRGMFIGNRIRLVCFFSGPVSMSTKA